MALSTGITILPVVSSTPYLEVGTTLPQPTETSAWQKLRLVDATDRPVLVEDTRVGETDPGFWVLRALQRCGLAWNVRTPEALPRRPNLMALDR